MCACSDSMCKREREELCVWVYAVFCERVFVYVRVCVGVCQKEGANRSFLNEGENERSVRISHRKRSPVPPISSISLNFFLFFPFSLYPLFLLFSLSSSLLVHVFL